MQLDILMSLRRARHNGRCNTLVIPGLAVDARIHSRVLALPLAARRRGIMLHYDDSARDDWALEWFQDPRCKNGYTWLVLDDGSLVELADPALRTPHAGPCLVPRANSAFYGISAATDGLVPATPAQLETIIRVCVEVSGTTDGPAPRQRTGSSVTMHRRCRRRSTRASQE